MSEIPAAKIDIPATVTLPGPELVAAIARLYALANYLYLTTTGGTATGPGEDAEEVAWHLFGLAFGEAVWFGPNNEPEPQGLTRLVNERADELLDEWSAEILRSTKHGEAVAA